MNEGAHISLNLRAVAKEHDTEIRRIKAGIQRDFVDLGQHLHEIRVRHLWRVLGFTSFRAYAKDRLGFLDRKAEYLIFIWRRLRLEMGLPKAEIQRIGWDRART